MKNIQNKIAISLFTLMFASSLSAGENEKDSHVSFNSSPISQELELRAQEQRKQEMIKMCEQEEFLSSLKIPIAWNEENAEAATGIVRDADYHWLQGFTQDNILQIEDSSQWSFDPYYGYIARSWRAGDVLVLSPKVSWIWSSNYAYVLTNRSLNSSIDVNPFSGPIAGGPNSTWIIGVNYDLGHVYVVNGRNERSTWIVYHSDLELFHTWFVNEHLIIGLNDNWPWTWFSTYDHILLNVEKNHFIRAKQL